MKNNNDRQKENICWDVRMFLYTCADMWDEQMQLCVYVYILYGQS